MMTSLIDGKGGDERPHNRMSVQRATAFDALLIATISVLGARSTALLAAEGAVGRIAAAGPAVAASSPAVCARLTELLAALLLSVSPPFSLRLHAIES
jgi:hypothetical protein